ncbi:J domain-containing protein [Chitinophaga agrisoli]|uniref:J domain-containing protein n=1 Tax=Chitinophaga agrisoli TaxID=2607653 RepID=A0A5B2VKI3_9BACT|nr:J domain-containing protein [Chitinophaga agrisoli]KAA2238757.1 J domain-containing protein [Chitinophaga agrisoli]
MTNYYEILELEDFADIEAIKAAHRKPSKLYHPDLNNGSKLL